MVDNQRKRGANVQGTFLVVAFVVLAGLPLGLALILSPSPGEDFLHEVGKGAGLLGFALLALQVALGSRLKFVDRPFGLDVVMQFHKGMGIFAGILILLHPVLLAVSGGSWRLFSFDTPWWITLGKVALFLLVLTIAFALLFKRLGVDYQIWRFLHKGAILVVALGFIHGLTIGSDLQSTGMKAYWWLLLTMALGLFAYRNVYVPIWGRRRFRVASARAESHDTYTLRLEPEQGWMPGHSPGQFMFLKLIRPGRPSEEHPFTISSSPTEGGFITATIKQSGDFTNTIGQTKPGDEARIEAPYGRFSFVHHDPPSVVFIAGGVGITPIRSMLRYMSDTSDERPVRLIYGNKTERDILFREELANLPGNIRVIHVLSKPNDTWGGLTGYVTPEIIKEHAGDLLDEAHFYVCGPPPMMDSTIKALRQFGVTGRRIHCERFAI